MQRDNDNDNDDDDRKLNKKSAFDPAQFYALKRNNSMLKSMWPVNPWSMNNSMTWQLCCWHDHQHSNAAHDDEVGQLPRLKLRVRCCDAVSARRFRARTRQAARALIESLRTPHGLGADANARRR